MKNTLLFLGVVVGIVLFFAGLTALQNRDYSGWWYIAGSILAFVFAAGPGRRLSARLRGD